ncbi:MAG: RnfABCDGE type electron transport complex subunit G [Bacteroidales bacterium]|nr:RnfABCDGE type electron transport complex subunit G [Bacteroidales bacterium]
MAKKAQSTLINMLLSLTVIAIVAAAALALVNKVTEEPIAQAKKAKTDEAIKAVLPQYDHTEELDVEGTACVLAYNEADSLVGVAVNSGSDKGFGGHLGVMYGFDTDGNITGYQILETSETPGLGAKADKWFQADGKGCVIGKNPGQNTIKVAKDGGEVDAISGSTITSRAFCEAVATAFETYQKINK